ncbi:hypothetical protein, partial [Stieleria sp.]
MTASDRTIDSPRKTAITRVLPARWATASLAPLLIALTTGCSTLPSARGLDLMNPAASLLSPGSAKNTSPYQMLDGTAPATA